MTPIFTIDRNAEITPSVAVKFIKKHISDCVPRLKLLEDYYFGKHSITNRSKKGGLANNRLTVNHAKYIADMSSSYLIGSPVTYSSKDGADISLLINMLDVAESAVQDMDLSLDCAVYGRAFEMVYMSSDEVPVLKLARLSPLNTFIVYDDTVERQPVFGVYYYPIYDDYGHIKAYNCSCQTAKYIYSFRVDSNLRDVSADENTLHYFGGVPINEIYNVPSCQADFEQVMSIIDAYDLLQSDRVNDKEQYVDAILLIKGATLGDTANEQTDSYNSIKDNRVMELPGEGADASFLTRQFDEAAVEILKKSIEKDIHKISCVPDMSDDNFAGNTSGVAMKYKLLGLEQLTKSKERFFREGLYYRLKLIANVMAVRGAETIDINNINVRFTRSLPTNDVEISSMVAALNGIVSSDTLLAQLPFVENAAAEADKIKAEKVAAQQTTQEMFYPPSEG